MKYRTRQFVQIVKNFYWNMYTMLYGIFHKRDESVWLFGAWMGEKFADNSRYLFQFLHENGLQYGIGKVIWASRIQEDVDMLHKEGYQSILIGTAESQKLHLLAGVHVICNSDGNSGSNGDISTELSAGARRIQLWHGVGIKASGRLKAINRATGIKRIIHENVIVPLLTPGHWNNCYFLTTSAESQRVIIADNGIPQSKIIRSAYPRLCKCPRLMPKEEKVVQKLLEQKRDEIRIVLYLPTFRASEKKDVSPTETNDFINFLGKNKILWIAKKHSADKSTSKTEKSQWVMKLDERFDINILYPYINLLVTDYSSASSDAMFWKKPTLEFCPDFDIYSQQDRGFVAPFEEYHAAPPVLRSDCLQEEILKRVNSPELYANQIEKIRHFLFEDDSQQYDRIVTSIIKK